MADAAKHCAQFGDRLDEGLITELDTMLRKHHPHCQAYLMAYEVYRRSNTSNCQLKMTIVSSRTKEARRVLDATTHVGRLNLLSLTDCLAVVFREDQLVNYCKQYIIVNHRIKGKSDACINTIPFHNPDLRPLWYALLFPQGQRPFYPGIPLAQPLDIDRKKLSDDLLNDDDGEDDEQVAQNEDMEGLARVVVRRRTASRKDVVLFHTYQRRPDLNHFAWNSGLLGQQ